VVQVITVQDVTNPTFTFVPANQTIYTVANCSYNALPATTGTATATDNCYFPVVTYTDEVIAGANAGQWTINRTWRAQDLSGNFVTAVQVITVTDNLFPTFTFVPANQSVCRNFDGTYANLVTTDLMGVALGQDNCTTNPAVTYTDDLTNIGDASTDGYITRTWTVTDAVGNATTVNQTIAVLHRPTVTITGPNTICANTTITLTGNGATGYVWNTTAITPSIEVTEAGTYSVIGTIANGCTNSAEITVTQFEIPTITSTVNDQICINEVITLKCSSYRC
jgi:large repetitive protein